MIAILVIIITDSGTIEYVAKFNHGQYLDRNSLYLDTVVQDIPYDLQGESNTKLLKQGGGGGRRKKIPLQ